MRELTLAEVEALSTPKPKLRPLSLFLLKEEVGEPRDAVRAPETLEWYDLRDSTGVDGEFALRRSTARPPGWASYVTPHLATDTAVSGLTNASTSAVLFVRTSGRQFAFAFGYGRHTLEPDAYEQDFGLKVVLNTVEPDRLTSVDARRFDELTMHTRRDVSQGSSFGVFGLDVSRDLVRAVTGPPRDQNLGRRASGSDALSLHTRAQFADLPGLCDRLLAAYGLDTYKERFGWIDHLRRVRDQTLIGALDERLLDEIRNERLVDIHLAPPEPLPWLRLGGFTFSNRGGDDVDADPRITEYLANLDSIGELELLDLKRDRVVAVGADTDQSLEEWSVYNCIVFDTRADDVLYALSAGQWYRVSESFADEVLRFAADLPQLAVDLPGAVLNVREEDFNQHAAGAIGALCLDQQLVRTPAGDRIELCDLLTHDRQFIHVKKRGSSSTLSHLFSQGLVSAELFAREPAFRTEARAVIAGLDGDYEPLVPADRPERDVWEVGFVVITRSNRDTPLTLPFFSLVNLRFAAQRLEDLGYKVSVLTVDER